MKRLRERQCVYLPSKHILVDENGAELVITRPMEGARIHRIQALFDGNRESKRIPTLERGTYSYYKYGTPSNVTESQGPNAAALLEFRVANLAKTK